MENSERAERNLIKKCQINYAKYIAAETLPGNSSPIALSKVDKCQKLTNGILSSWLLRGLAKYVKVEPTFGKGSLHPQKRMIFRRFSKRPLTCMHDLFVQVHE